MQVKLRNSDLKIVGGVKTLTVPYDNVKVGEYGQQTTKEKSLLEEEGKVSEKATQESQGDKETQGVQTDGEFESAKGSSLPAEGSVIKAFLRHDVKIEKPAK